MADLSDRRITNQHKYLYGKSLVQKAFVSKGNWDHEHCAFCFYKILPGDVEYCTLDEKHWVCKNCFEDFKECFELTEAKTKL